MPEKDANLAFCLERIGKSAAGWDTLVVRGSAEAAASAEDLWAAWADVERWPDWSPLLRPAVARRWNRAFQGAVDGLIRRTAGGAAA